MKRKLAIIVSQIEKERNIGKQKEKEKTKSSVE